MPNRSSAALGAAVLAALVIAGCGSSGGSTATTTVPTAAAVAAKARFSAQAKAICDRLSEQEAPLRARQESLRALPATGGDAAFVALARQVVALSRGAEGRIAALPRPVGDAQAIGRLLASYSAEVADAAALANAAAKQEADLGEAAEKALRSDIAASSALASRYGMRACLGSG